MAGAEQCALLADFVGSDGEVVDAAAFDTFLAQVRERLGVRLGLRLTRLGLALNRGFAADEQSEPQHAYEQRSRPTPRWAPGLERHSFKVHRSAAGRFEVCSSHVHWLHVCAES